MNCLLFAGGQVVYSRFIRLPPVAAGNRVEESAEPEQNSKVVDRKTKTMSSRTLKSSVELRGTAVMVFEDFMSALGVNFLWLFPLGSCSADDSGSPINELQVGSYDLMFTALDFVCDQN